VPLLDELTRSPRSRPDRLAWTDACETGSDEALVRVASSTAARKLLDAGSERVALRAVAELDATPLRLRGTTLVLHLRLRAKLALRTPGTASSTPRSAASASSRCAGSSSPTRRGPGAGGSRPSHRLRDALG
jgi:hypothetical protein